MDLFDVLALAGCAAFIGGLWLLPAWAAGLALVVVGVAGLLAGLAGSLLASTDSSKDDSGVR